MADLPSDRITGDNPSFFNTGIDYFGPFTVHQGRKTQKRYGVIFSCLASTAVHLEVPESLNTDSFIAALRRFLCRRGNVKTLRPDNGTNFVGANRELRQAVRSWNQAAIEASLLQVGIQWHFSAPFSSHANGVCEREIRSIRKILSALMNDRPLKLWIQRIRWLWSPQLQRRQKWNQVRETFKVGDPVLVINSFAPRNVWPMARIIEVDNISNVQLVKLRLNRTRIAFKSSTSRKKSIESSTKSVILSRPIDKLILIQSEHNQPPRR